MEEGISVFRPEGGLDIYNQTQRTRRVVPGSSFHAVARADEIFVICFSRSDTIEKRAKFGNVCVVVDSIPKLCDRIQDALPSTATFFAHRVDYYDPAIGGTPTYALPDLIATSKHRSYKWQDEHRIVFSFTDSLGFEKVDYKLLTGAGTPPPPRTTPHPEYHLQTRDLQDFCRVHEL